MAEKDDKKIIDDQEVDPNGNQEVDNHENNDEVEPTLDELKAKLKESEEARTKGDEKNSRLERESKDWKGKFQANKKKEDDAEIERLKKSGKTDELLELEIKRNNELQNDLVKTKTKTIRQKLENKILKLYPNVIDVDDVIHNLDAELYEVDSDNLTVTGVKEAVDDVLKRKPNLFKTKKMMASYNGDIKTPDLTKGMITREAWLKLPYKEKMKKMDAGEVEGLPTKAG